MKHDDEKLNALLRTWEPRPIPSTDIRRAVWQRIEQQEEQTESRWVSVLLAWFGRPAIAGGLFIFAIGVGAAFGTAATAQAQINSYLQTVSPFLHMGQ